MSATQRSPPYEKVILSRETSGSWSSRLSPSRGSAERRAGSSRRPARRAGRVGRKGAPFLKDSLCTLGGRRGFGPLDPQPLRAGELDAALVQDPEEGEVDRLLAVHIEVEVGREDGIDDLEVEAPAAETAEAFQVGALEADLLLALDDRAGETGHLLQLLGRGAVGDGEGQGDGPALHPPEVPDPAFQQIAVAEDQLLAG